jgi:diketogulonate reductase-like aldo/keto reductase
MAQSDEGQHGTSVADRVALGDGNTIPYWRSQCGKCPRAGVRRRHRPRRRPRPELWATGLGLRRPLPGPLPAGGPTWAWPGMERAAKLGWARAVGVSNVDMLELQALTKTADVAPVVDRVQLSPFSSPRKLLEKGARPGVHFEAYSPLGTVSHLTDRTERDMAAQRGRLPAQVLLRWRTQRGQIVITKSTHEGRIAENGAILDFELAASEMKALDTLDRTDGTAPA